MPVQPQRGTRQTQAYPVDGKNADGAVRQKPRGPVALQEEWHAEAAEQEEPAQADIPDPNANGLEQGAFQVAMRQRRLIIERLGDAETGHRLVAREVVSKVAVANDAARQSAQELREP